MANLTQCRNRPPYPRYPSLPPPDPPPSSFEPAGDPAESSDPAPAALELRIVTRDRPGGGGGGVVLSRDNVPVALQPAWSACDFGMAADHEGVLGHDHLPMLFIMTPKVRLLTMTPKV